MATLRAGCVSRRLMLRAATVAMASTCLLSSAEAQCPIQLRDVTESTGISFQHTDGGSGQRYIVESVSAGLALFDYDADGDVDIYFLNGEPLQGTEVDVPPRNVLYRNDGGWKFTDMTEQAGVGDTGFGLGVCAGDYDNDGDVDLYLNNYGPNVLYRNNADGTFTDVAQEAGVADGDRVGAGVNFLDIDKDGDLDLFVSRYLKFSYDTHVSPAWKGVSYYPGPRDHDGEVNALYRNNGDGTFTDISVESGIAAHVGWGMGTTCCDYDNDGDTDILVGNDVGANFLFQNDGKGMFEEIGLTSGLAMDISGREQGSMGADWGDYDNDGWFDLHVTSYQAEFATLYKNLGNGFFADVTLRTGAGSGTFPYVTWGNSFMDFDSDGNRDIFIACGHIQDNVDHYSDVSAYRVRNILLMNTGNGKFVDMSDTCGDGLKAKFSSRGAGFDDLDNDGDIDVVIQNSRMGPTILRNDSTNKNHWLQVRLKGVKTNRDGVGARVKVVAGDLTQNDEVHSGRGYQSHFGTRLHFGLGKRDRVERVEVRWIGGDVDVVKDVRVDQLLTITEGSSQSSDEQTPKIP